MLPQTRRPAGAQLLFLKYTGSATLRGYLPLLLSGHKQLVRQDPCAARRE